MFPGNWTTILDQRSTGTYAWSYPTGIISISPPSNPEICCFGMNNLQKWLLTSICDPQRALHNYFTLCKKLRHAESYVVAVNTHLNIQTVQTGSSSHWLTPSVWLIAENLNTTAKSVSIWISRASWGVSLCILGDKSTSDTFEKLTHKSDLKSCALLCQHRPYTYDMAEITNHKPVEK